MSRDRWLAALSAALIVAAAAALRVWQLDTVPLGLHNDEAMFAVGGPEAPLEPRGSRGVANANLTFAGARTRAGVHGGDHHRIG